MSDLTGVIDAASPWFWFALAFAVGILDLFLGSFLLFALAVAIAPIGVLLLIAPATMSDWRLQAVIIVVLWAAATVVFRRLFGARRRRGGGGISRRDVNDY